MSRGISIKICREIYAARNRNNKTWRGKKLPSRHILRIIISNSIINEILAEERRKKNE